MMTIVLGIVIAIYCIWVIRKQIKKFKNGQYCGCGCGSPDCKKGCKSKKEELGQ